MLLGLTMLFNALAAEPAGAHEQAQPSNVQLAFHAGLLQPILTDGFNAAVDLRFDRVILSYSHGEGLDLSGVPGILPADQRDLGVTVEMPWTTGGGVGWRIVDELYVMADVKVHGFEVDAGLDVSSYTTVTVGGEVGYRLFLWEGFYISPVIRYWPTVWSSAPDGFRIQTDAGTFQHDPLPQGVNGVFANVLVGWSFDVRGKRRTYTVIDDERGDQTGRR
ncbi:MAG: hypothetical protein AAFV53_24760 [Myxococcota bacterium]